MSQAAEPKTCSEAAIGTLLHLPDSPIQHTCMESTDNITAAQPTHPDESVARDVEKAESV